VADPKITSSDEVLVVRDLCVDFTSLHGALHAVRGVDFTLSRGECLGIVGESGSGKSVTVSAVLGLLGKGATVSGTILLDGEDLVAASFEDLRGLRGKKISMIFQEPSRSFDPIYSIGKTFAETFRAKSPELPDAEIRRRSVKLLTEVHIPRAEERLHNFPHQFSGGMLQRIMIALALANDPEVLIADEPTTALDVTIQAQIVSLLKELQQHRRLSLIFISHNLGLVGQIADRILVMYGGLVLESGASSRVLGEPRSPYSRALLSALPAWGTHYSSSGLYTIPGNVPDPTRPEPGCPFAPRCTYVLPACTAALPDMTMEETSFRCVLPGVKV